MDGVRFDESTKPGHDGGDTGDGEAHGDSERHSQAQGLHLLEAVQNRDIDTVKSLLDKGYNLVAKNQDGKDALHLAVKNHDKPMSQLLLESGADPESADNAGSTPLYVAAGTGTSELVELLLTFCTDVESLNIETGHTALHQAVEHKNVAVAKLLLEKGADVDARIPTNGHTPLMNAVILGDLKLVELLLRRGADKKIQLANGKKAEDFAIGDNSMVDILRADYILQGPSITNRQKDRSARVAPITFFPPDQVDKLNACHGFEASIIDFFSGDREQRIQVSSSIYELLYGKGPNAIMASVKGEKLNGQEPLFRWYHLPANNLEWVEVLVNRIFSEQKHNTAVFDVELKSKLALTNSAGRQFRAPTTHSSFMRPLCRTIKPVSNIFSPSSKPGQTMLFIPYLHFENYRDYQKMSQTLSYVKDQAAQGERRRRGLSLARYPSNLPPPRRKRSEVETGIVTVTEDVSGPSGAENSADEAAESAAVTMSRRGRYNLRSKFRALGEKVGLRPRRAAKSEPEGSSSGLQGDPKKGEAPVENEKTSGTLLRMDSRGAGDSQPVPAGKSDASPDDAAVGRQSPPPNKEDAITTENVESRPRVDSVGAGKAAGGAGSSSASGTGSVAEPATDINADDQVESTVTGLQSTPVSVAPIDGRQSTVETARKDMDDDPGGDSGAKTADTVPESSQRSRQGGRSRSRKQRVRWESLDEDLLRGYLAPSKPGEAPPLQLRRTLDQYFYTHLASTSERDGDQVVYRYTNRSPEPKMFMVDQLWLWVLNEDTVISCCPQRWGVLSGGRSNPNDRRENPGIFSLVPPPPPMGDSDFYSPPSPRPPPDVNIRASDPSDPLPDPSSSKREQVHRSYKRESGYQVRPQTKSGSKNRNKDGGLSDWIAGGRSKPKPVKRGVQKRREYEIDILDDEPAFTEERRRRLAFLETDPLNVHQTILKYLQGSARPPITSVYDMASIITDTCVNMFDQYQTPDEFQFFDFFERSIGLVLDREAQCFQQYAKRLASERYNPDDSQELFSIRTETELLVEIKDIRDELGVLQMVLTDQSKTLADFSRVVSKSSGSEFDTMSLRDESAFITQNKVLESHLYRIEKMEKLAEKTYQALNHLLDLKQKQANVSEALSSRKQAENTSRQAELSAQHAKEGVAQAELARKQAEDTARQGKTLLVFTVVTIIFLPLSFLSAFFAINIDQFPWNKDDKLPMDYVLKYMFSISGAVSVPFILVAFNQDRIAEWLKGHGKVSAIWTAIILLSTILLAVIWTRGLASGISAAVTVIIILLVIVAAFVHLVYTLRNMANRSSGGSSSGSYSSYSYDYSSS